MSKNGIKNDTVTTVHFGYNASLISAAAKLYIADEAQKGQPWLQMNKPFSPDPELDKVLRRLAIIAAYDESTLCQLLEDLADDIETQQADDDLDYERKVRKIRRRLA